MKNRKAAVGFIFTTVLLDVIGLGIIIPIIPTLLKELLNSDLSDASRWGGLLAFSFSIVQFIFAPVIGNISDRYGRRPVLLITMFAFGIDYFLMAWAPTIGWLFLGRIIAGIAGASFPTAQAYIADISTNENRTQNFGMLYAAFGLGFVLGPVLGGILGQYDTRLPFIVSACLSLLNWLYGYFVLPESLTEEKRRTFSIKRANPIGALRQMRKYPLLVGLSVSLFFIYIGSHAIQTTWSFITMERYGWSESMIGYSLGAAGLLIALVQGVLVRLIVPRIGPAKALFTGLTLHGIGQLLFACSVEGWMMFVVLIPYCISGIAGPSIQSIMTAEVKSDEQGELQGAFASLLSITNIIGPLAMTNLFSFFTSANRNIHLPQAPFIAGSVLAGFSLFFAVKALKHHRHKK